MNPQEEMAMQMILHGGNARSLSFEALEQAKNKEYALSEKTLQQADKELEAAHEIQTQLLQSEAQGVLAAANFLFVHAMDHVMNAQCEKGLIAEIIELYRKIDERAEIRDK